MVQELQHLNQAFGIAMEEAKFAYPAKTLGQHMPQQDPEQLTTGNGLEDGVALVYVSLTLIITRPFVISLKKDDDGAGRVNNDVRQFCRWW